MHPLREGSNEIVNSNSKQTMQTEEQYKQPDLIIKGLVLQQHRLSRIHKRQQAVTLKVGAALKNLSRHKYCTLRCGKCWVLIGGHANTSPIRKRPGQARGGDMANVCPIKRKGSGEMKVISKHQQTVGGLWEGGMGGTGVVAVARLRQVTYSMSFCRSSSLKSKCFNCTISVFIFHL